MATTVRPHMVINDDRTITVPEDLKRLAIQYDHNVESVEFDCPRYWDDSDLSVMSIYINYETPDGQLGAHQCTEVAVDDADDTMIHFVWTILKPVTALSGVVKFSVCARNVNDDPTLAQRWHTEPCEDCSIVPGIPCAEDEVIIPDNYDADAMFNALNARIDNVMGNFANYDADNNFIVDNAESVNGVKFGRDNNGVFAESDNLKSYFTTSDDVKDLESLASRAAFESSKALDEAQNAQSVASSAQATASSAQATADGKVSKSGDTMTGALVFSSAYNGLRFPTPNRVFSIHTDTGEDKVSLVVDAKEGGWIATCLQADANGNMIYGGGTFTGNVEAYSANRTHANLRNIETLDANWKHVSTNYIRTLRK